MKNIEHIKEVQRYIDNAKDILKTKGGNGTPGYYSDVKYVKMACNTAWSGVLVAMDEKLPPPRKKNRRNIKDYEEYLSKKNQKALHDFVEAYKHLHLFGGYDGTLIKKTIHTGIELAENIIKWCEKNWMKNETL